MQLHAVIIGLIEYIIRSCLYLYICTLRNSDLVRADGRPLVSDAQLSRIARRLQERFRETCADETMLNITPSFLELYNRVFGAYDSVAKMQGDKLKMTLLLNGHFFRDLIHDEVLLNNSHGESN